MWVLQKSHNKICKLNKNIHMHFLSENVSEKNIFLYSIWYGHTDNNMSYHVQYSHEKTYFRN